MVGLTRLHLHPFLHCVCIGVFLPFVFPRLIGILNFISFGWLGSNRVCVPLSPDDPVVVLADGLKALISKIRSSFRSLDCSERSFESCKTPRHPSWPNRRVGILIPSNRRPDGGVSLAGSQTLNRTQMRSPHTGRNRHWVSSVTNRPTKYPVSDPRCTIEPHSGLGRTLTANR